MNKMLPWILCVSAVLVAAYPGTDPRFKSLIVLDQESAPAEAAPAGTYRLVVRNGEAKIIDGDGVETAIATGNQMPVGTIVSFSGISSPAGWELGDGGAISRTDFASLFAVTGTTYGAGDGTTTFNKPDCRGRALVGRDDMGGAAANRITAGISGINGTVLGAAGGAEGITGTIGGSQSIAHTHNIAHAHQVLHRGVPSGDLSDIYGLSTLDDSVTTFTFPANGTLIEGQAMTSGGTGSSRGFISTLTRSYYSGGVLSPPTGSAGASASSGAMSANATVSGSNFTFTGTGSRNVQPSLIVNCIIKI